MWRRKKEFTAHVCALKEEKEIVRLSRKERFKQKWFDLIKVSKHNPLCAVYFKSDRSVEVEIERHRNSKHPYIIHPLSLFRGWYEVYLLCLHFLQLMHKPIEIGFAHPPTKDIFTGYVEISAILDTLCIIDVIITFFTGYTKHTERRVIIDPKAIARKYLVGFCVFDILSSIPVNLAHLLSDHVFVSLEVEMLCNVAMILRLARLHTVTCLMYKAIQFFGVNVKGVAFLMSSIIILFLISHWMTCLQFGVPIMVHTIWGQGRDESNWVIDGDFTKKPFVTQYLVSLYRTTACILGVYLPLNMKTNEEYAVTIVCYIIGKVVLFANWIVLVIYILGLKLMELQFLELMNQIEVYLLMNKVPTDLQAKLKRFLHFKYQKKYFKEETIMSFFTENLRSEVKKHMCKHLIYNIPFLHQLTNMEQDDLLLHLTPIIFMSRDTIMRAGDVPEAVYIIYSGTVAVFTHSGKEVVHLGDGNIVGELSVVLKVHQIQSTVIAIETTQMYRLSITEFEKYMTKNKRAFKKLKSWSKKQYKVLKDAEDEFKRQQFEKIYADIRGTHQVPSKLETV